MIREQRANTRKQDEAAQAIEQVRAVHERRLTELEERGRDIAMRREHIQETSELIRSCLREVGAADEAAFSRNPEVYRPLTDALEENCAGAARAVDDELDALDEQERELRGERDREEEDYRQEIKKLISDTKTTADSTAAGTSADAVATAGAHTATDTALDPSASRDPDGEDGK
jgi:hypothetical protein